MTRKFIFETKVGSHLYGTALPTSDDDFKGVFLPSMEDLLGMQSCPGELSMSSKISDGPRNTAGDVDRKFYSLQKFLKHAADGQPWAMEMLFSPVRMVQQVQPEWIAITQEAMPLILSRKGVAGFIGFALAQSYKATIKGENLNLIRSLVEFLCGCEPGQRTIDEVKTGERENHLIFGTVAVPKALAEDGTEVIEIAGRKFNYGLKAVRFLNSLYDMESRYGTRSNAAAEGGQDYKSLYHAYRLIFEAKEFLATGHITLPRPEAPLLLQIRQGLYEADYQAELQAHIDDIRKNIETNSPLPELPKWDKINEFCIDMLRDHLFRYEK